MKTPVFAGQPAVHLAARDLVALLYDTRELVLDGRLYALVAPLIDGRRSVAEIADRLRGRATIVDVRFALKLLERQGLIVDARRRVPDANVRTFEPSDPGTPGSWHLRTSECRDARFDLILTDDYLAPALSRVNHRALRDGRRWLLVKPAGVLIWIGPLFVPRRTACWTCLSRRLHGNRPVAAALLRERRGGAPEVRGTRDPCTAPEVGARALREMNALVDETSDPQAGAVLITLDPVSLESTRHQVTRLPDCPDCGRPVRRSARRVPPRLGARPRVPSCDGGYRAATPEDTWRRFEHHVSPLTGLVSHLRPHFADPDGLIQTCLAEHVFVPSGDDREALARAFRRTSAGKGMTAAEARTGALCEALERISGCFRGDEPRRRASARDLGAQAIHPNACMNFSARQYRRRTPRAAADPARVPAPFDERRAIDWSPVWSLTDGRWRFVPTAYCYYGYCATGDTSAFCRADSNGNAAGASIEDAILQGFLELVERDAVALWWYNRVTRPSVDLATVPLPYVQRLVARYRALDRRIRVFDITTDLEIPAFAAVSTRTRSRRGRPDIMFGFGSHLDAMIALTRALTELNQFLPGALAGAPPPAFADDALLQEPFLGAVGPATPWAGAPRHDSQDIRDDVETCARRAAARGLDTLVLDQTRADVGLPVVKVIVPGLRQFWPRFGPGRLYDVPVALGWLAAPHREDELHQRPFFV